MVFTSSQGLSPTLLWPCSSMTYYRMIRFTVHRMELDPTTWDRRAGGPLLEACLCSASSTRLPSQKRQDRLIIRKVSPAQKSGKQRPSFKLTRLCHDLPDDDDYFQALDGHVPHGTRDDSVLGHLGVVGQKVPDQQHPNQAQYDAEYDDNHPASPLLRTWFTVERYSARITVAAQSTVWTTHQGEKESNG